MITAGRDRKRQTSEYLDLQFRACNISQGPQGSFRQFRRQADSDGPTTLMIFQSGFVIDVDKGANGMVLAAKKAHCRQVIGFNQIIRSQAGHVLYGFLIPIIHNQHQAGEYDFFAGILQPFDHLRQIIFPGQPFMTNHFPHMHNIDRCLVGDRIIKITGFVAVPVKH